MFGIGFWEIILISIIAIIALGPEKFPKAFIQVMKIISQVKNKISEFSDEVESHIGIEELKEEAKKYSNILNDEINIDEHNKALNKSKEDILNNTIENDGITEDEYIKSTILKKDQKNR